MRFSESASEICLLSVAATFAFLAFMDCNWSMLSFKPSGVSTWRKLTQAQAKYANSTKKKNAQLSVKPNLGPFYCKA